MSRKNEFCTVWNININKKEIEYKQLYVKYNVQEVIDYIKKIKFPGYKDVLRLFYGTF